MVGRDRSVVDDDPDNEPVGGGLSGFVDRAMTIKLHPDLLRKALREHERMPPEDRADLTAQMISIIKILDGVKRVKKRDRPALGHAVHLRLVALARLNDRPEMRAYSLEGKEKGCSFIHDDVVVAASKAPLVQVDEYTIAFDEDAFFQILLRDGRHDGRA